MSDNRLDDNQKPRDNSEAKASERFLNEQQVQPEQGDKNIPIADRYNNNTKEERPALEGFLDAMRTPEGQQAYLKYAMENFSVDALKSMIKGNDEAIPKVTKVVAGVESMLKEAQARV